MGPRYGAAAVFLIMGPRAAIFLRMVPRYVTVFLRVMGPRAAVFLIMGPRYGAAAVFVGPNKKI
jgi:hypothetical protein